MNGPKLTLRPGSSFAPFRLKFRAPGTDKLVSPNGRFTMAEDSLGASLSLTSEERSHVEEAARSLAERGRHAEAWFLRGVTDAMEEAGKVTRQCAPSNVGEDEGYRKGYNFGKRGVRSLRRYDR